MIPAKRILKAGLAGRAGWSSLRRLDQFIDRLRVVERFADRETRAHASVELAGSEQLVVPALGDDLPAVENENAVRVAYGREAMRDDDRRAARPKPPKRGKDDFFGNGVERRGRLVEDQNRRVF